MEQCSFFAATVEIASPRTVEIALRWSAFLCTLLLVAGEGGGGGGFDGSNCFPLAGLSGSASVTFFCAGTLLGTFSPFDDRISGSASVTFFRVRTFPGPPTGTASAVSLWWGFDLDTRGIA